MKREFLQSLKENEQPLSKQTIDAIMAENGRDIQATRALFADYEQLKAQLQQAQEAAAALQQADAAQWEEKMRQMQLQHEKQLQDLAFDHTLERSIRDMGGRNHKAVAALLELEQIRSSENPNQALQAALETMKQENAWLFETTTPPPYARGTGANAPHLEEQPATLAGALREKFERK